MRSRQHTAEPFDAAAALRSLADELEGKGSGWREKPGITWTEDEHAAFDAWNASRPDSDKWDILDVLFVNFDWPLTEDSYVPRAELETMENLEPKLRAWLEATK